MGKDILVGITGCVFWLRKLAKARAKALKGKNTFLAHLFMKIKEIRRNVR